MLNKIDISVFVRFLKEELLYQLELRIILKIDLIVKSIM